MNIQNYAQSTVESCLACCLLQLRYFYEKKKIAKKEEQQLLFDALALGRPDFVGNHLAIFFKKTKIKTMRYGHNKLLCDWAKKSKGNSIVQHEIDLNFIDQLLNKGPLTIVVDNHIFSHFGHYPHWIVIYQKQGNNYLIYDPWLGEKKLISKTLLKTAIDSFLKKLWMAPQIITLKMPVKQRPQ